MGKLSLLAIFAHPDDESCGPGGALASYAHQRVAVSLVCATRGEGGVCDDEQCEDYRTASPEVVATTRMQELGCACKALGIRRWSVLGYPDGGLAQCNRRALEEELVRWVRTTRPQVIVTCYPEGEAGHPDHDTVARVATRAYLGAGRARRFQKHLREGLNPWQPLKLYYAIPADPEVATQCNGQQPLTTVDVSPFINAKFRAMQCHASQKGCSQGLVEAMRNSDYFTESFKLAHSRLPTAGGPEFDLFAGVVEAEKRRLAR